MRINPEQTTFKRPGYQAEVKNGASWCVHIQTDRKQKFHIEPARGPETAPIASRSRGWVSSLTEFADINREAGTGEPPQKRGLFGSLVASLDSTKQAATAGLSPSYLTLQSPEDGGFFKVCNGYRGRCFCVEATEGGPAFYARPGSFILCDQGIRLGTKMVHRDSVVTTHMGFSHWLTIGGDGLCFLLAGDALGVSFMEPGEEATIYPPMLMGISETVSVVGLRPVEGSPSARLALGYEQELVIKAGSEGGYCCLSGRPVHP